MADKSQKYPENVPGAFYVDNTCIDCDACRQVAPNNFGRNDDDGYTFVCKQPADDAEKQQMMEAVQNCPVECIGIDG